MSVEQAQRTVNQIDREIADLEKKMAELVKKEAEKTKKMNYPYECESLACKEQLKVLAQLTAAGTRLANSIVKSKGEYDMLKEKDEKYAI